jgi:hypothetical protein
VLLLKLPLLLLLLPLRLRLFFNFGGWADGFSLLTRILVIPPMLILLLRLLLLSLLTFFARLLTVARTAVGFFAGLSLAAPPSFLTDLAGELFALVFEKEMVRGMAVVLAATVNAAAVAAAPVEAAAAMAASYPPV